MTKIMTHQGLIERRAAQIYDYLVLMRRRRAEGSDCFLVFDEHGPSELRRRPPPGMEFADGYGHAKSAGPPRTIKDSFNHYVQFAFDADAFYIDLPAETLHPDEAVRLTTEREGFFFLGDVQELSADLVALNPLQKIYKYGEEWQAAHDVVFILLDLWNIPVDFRWYVKAASFDGDDDRWEWGVPMA